MSNDTGDSKVMISAETILTTANLSKLRLTDDEAKLFESQLSEALASFSSINDVDIEGVEPLISPMEEEMKLRQDISRSDEVTQKVLDQAPELQGRLFRVPPVV